MERNFCKESGCPAVCCRDFNGNFPQDTDLFLRVFPEAHEVEDAGALFKKMKDKEPGAFYYMGEDWMYFAVNGNCPNLGEDKSCRIHGESYYPKACLNFLFDGDKCRDARVLRGVTDAIELREAVGSTGMVKSADGV